MRVRKLFEEQRDAFRPIRTEKRPVVWLQQRIEEFRKDVQTIAATRDQRQRLLKGLILLFNRKRIHRTTVEMYDGSTRRGLGCDEEKTGRFPVDRNGFVNSADTVIVRPNLNRMPPMVGDGHFNASNKLTVIGKHMNGHASGLGITQDADDRVDAFRGERGNGVKTSMMIGTISCRKNIWIAAEVRRVDAQMRSVRHKRIDARRKNASRAFSIMFGDRPCDHLLLFKKIGPVEFEDAPAPLARIDVRVRFEAGLCPLGDQGLFRVEIQMRFHI
jgi:hypothetical protein